MICVYGGTGSGHWEGVCDGWRRKRGGAAFALGKDGEGCLKQQLTSNNYYS